MEQILKEPNGRIAFSTEHNGDHKICFILSDPSGQNSNVKFILENPKKYKKQVFK